MDTRIKNVVNDLIELDPSFKAQEQELTSIVSTILCAKPDTALDENFQRALRAELLKTPAPRPLKSPYGSIFVSRIFYGVLGSALSILILVPITFITTQKITSPDKPLVLNPFSINFIKNITTGLQPKQQISNKGGNAFGTLALVPTPISSGNVSEPKTPALISHTQPEDISSPASLPVSSLEIRTPSVPYLVSYSGDSVALPETEGKVFKQSDASKNFSTFQTPLPSGVLRVQEIDPLMYGKPSVVSTTHSKEGTTTISVLYPLLIDGKEVRESNGAVAGPIVTLDAVHKNILSVNKLNPQTYDSSPYLLETDFSKILKHALETLKISFEGENPTTTPMARLQTPKQVLMRFGDLYVPAFLFDISYNIRNENQVLPSKIVVPIVRDFLHQSSSEH